MDGLCHSNHTPTPGLIEYKKAIELVQVLETESTEGKVIIVNRYDHVTLDHLKCEWHVVGDGHISEKREVSIPKGVRPGAKAAIFIPSAMASSERGEYLEVSFALKKDTNWARAGHEVAFGQIPISIPSPQLRRSAVFAPPMPAARLPPAAARPIVSHMTTRYGTPVLRVETKTNTFEFDKTTGLLCSWVTGDGTQVFANGANGVSPSSDGQGQPLMNIDFYRPLTDNEAGNDGREWREGRLHQMRMHLKAFSCDERAEGAEGAEQDGGSVIVDVKHRIAPPVFNWSVDTSITYTISASGSLSLHVKGKPRGSRLPRTWARIGLTLVLAPAYADGTAKWYGRGPGEAYSDSKMAQRVGNWECGVRELGTSYEFPQENGNRADVRWVAFSQGGRDSDNEGKGEIRASFGKQTGCSFSALPYSCGELDQAGHLYELESLAAARQERDGGKGKLFVRLDWKHQGLGSGSCGPRVGEEYELKVEEFEVQLMLE
jgi:beta-galactosidase